MVPPAIVPSGSQCHHGYLSSVLSASEMAGFRSALLHAWLLLWGRGRAQRGGSSSPAHSQNTAVVVGEEKEEKG